MEESMQHACDSDLLLSQCCGLWLLPDVLREFFAMSEEERAVCAPGSLAFAAFDELCE